MEVFPTDSSDVADAVFQIAIGQINMGYNVWKVHSFPASTFICFI